MLQFFGLVFAAMAIAVPGHALAQQRSDPIKHIVIFDGGQSNPAVRARVATIRRKIQAKGWIEGRNARFSIFYGQSSTSVVKQHVEKIAALKPDIICVSTGNAAHQIKASVADIPIVFVHVSNPIVSGLVESVPKPGSNITGVATWEISATQKLVEMLHDIAPKIKNVVTIFVPAPSARKLYGDNVAKAAERFGWKHRQYLARDKSQLVAVLRKIRNIPNPGLILLPDPNVVGNADLLATFSRENRIPAIAGYSRFARKGGLMSYSSNFDRIYENVADMIDKILRGTPISSLPVRFPYQYDLIVNLQAFRALMLAPPTSLLMRANSVIELR